ncbi:hypothetical protein GM418_25430 [Maribellus comscasis]|uniref:Uncharacterized protein n=1 Tax=Maribellus comscasis TaxID=2681766 RepID=A0A6I6K0C4_9BACT|nr:hypothetical protein [Maribellus comscasis]QGY46878.1 hypothetical protein GM418_25430 [Maribellus comscasis]
MTNTTARNLVFDKRKTEQMLKGKKGVWDALVDRWDYHVSVMTWDPPVPADKQWIMWDVAIIEAFLHPEMVKAETVYPLKNKPQRKITVYTRLDAEAMKNDYWKSIQTYMNMEK